VVDHVSVGGVGEGGQILRLDLKLENADIPQAQGPSYLVSLR